MGDSSNEAEVLGRSGLERAIAYCNTKGERVGPFFEEVLGYTTQGEVDYVHGLLLDGRTGHYRLSDVSEAFGGPQETFCDKFEDIDKVPHLRVTAAGEKTALNNPKGRRYTGSAYGTIQRDDSTPLEGIVYHVQDGGKEGFFLNEELCGRHNGMNHKSTIVQVGDKIFLIAENEKGIKKVVDINTGEIKYGDEDKCTDVELVMIGNELCAKKTYGSTDQELRAKNGDTIYYGLRTKVGEWFNSPSGPIVRTYDKNGWLVPVDRRGKPRFAKDPVSLEANDSPKGDGVHKIDGKLYMKFLLIKEDPCNEDDKWEVTYRDKECKDAFKGPHDEEVPSMEGRPNRVTVQGITAILFKSRATKTMYWIGSNGRSMFGGEHWDDTKTIECPYGPEGRKLDGATILKHLEDVGRGHTVLDYQANAYFQNKDSETPEYHDDIRDFWVLSYKKDGEDRNVLVLEAEDHVGGGRRIKSAISNLVCFRWGQLFKTPSTYYLMDGTKRNRWGAIKKYLGSPRDAQLVNVDNFKDATVRSIRPRETQMMEAVSLITRVDPEVKELLAKAEAASASSGKSPANGETTPLGAGLFPEEGPSADADVAEEPAPAEIVESPKPAEEAVAEETPEQLPDGTGGESKKWPDWLTGSEDGGEEGGAGKEE